MDTDTSISTAGAFIKWVGGKQSLASKLVEYMPDDYRTYFEPFLGGGSVFFKLSPKKAVLTDSNTWLVDTYLAIKDDWSLVASYLEKFKNTKEDFLKIRKVDPNTLDLHRRAAQFIYLNKTCFRGLFRVNRNGQFNVPYGAYERRYFDPNNLEAVSDRLTNVEIRKGDFEGGIIGARKTDFVYFDPPYYKLGGYSDFNRYTPNQFREDDHVRLASLCNELDERGIRWAVSNSNTPFVRELFSGYRMEQIDARREINLNSQSRDVKELLILNY